MVKVEVRCCCQPRKLLGWLDVPSPTIHVGQRVTFLLGPLSWSWAEGFSDAELLTLVIAEYWDGYQSGLAFKAEETPVEVLRRVSCFVENVTPTSDIRGQTRTRPL